MSKSLLAESKSGNHKSGKENFHPQWESNPCTLTSKSNALPTELHQPNCNLKKN